MARIMIVDDDPFVSDLLFRALTRQNHTVIVAHDGAEAIALLRAETPEVIVLDIVMPNVNGIQVCQYARTNPVLASIPILFLTTREAIEDKIQGYEAGGDDYMTKPFDLTELGLRVNALLRYSTAVVPTGTLRVGDIEADPDRATVQVGDRAVELTPVEFELLYYLMSYAGQVIPTETLLQEVWGYPPGTGNSSLVRMHILNLRRKIEQNSKSPKYLRTVPRHGYTLSEKAD